MQLFSLLFWKRETEVFGGIVPKLLEVLIVDKFAKETGEVWFVPVGKFSAWDGSSQSRRHSVEVKLDTIAASSFRLCLEYLSSGKPSGLAVTQATRWCSCVPIDASRICVYEFDTDKLRDAMRAMPLHRGCENGKNQFKFLWLQDADILCTRKFEIVIPWNEIKPTWERAAS